MDPTEDNKAKDENVANERLHVGSRNEFEDVDRKVIDVNDREIGVFKIDGEFYALANYCPHQGGPVCEGEITGTIAAKKDDEWSLSYERENEIVACPWHGWEFDITSGENLTTDDFAVPRYEVVVEGSDIYIEI